MRSFQYFKNVNFITHVFWVFSFRTKHTVHFAEIAPKRM